MIESLYIHIPFCNSICTYCSFKKRIYNQNDASNYVLNLVKDLKRIKPQSLKTIYIGGGTPSSLANNDLEVLLKSLKPLLINNYEFTIESNPENLLDQDKIDLFKKYGVNRVSIGIQTFNNNYLKILGRKHDDIIINKSINNLINSGIDNISIDLIYGIPTQSLNDFVYDIYQALKFPIKHISLYSLTIDKHTILFNKDYKEADEDLLRDMSDIATNILKNYGFIKYEVSNYSLENYESKHNLTYWFDNEYYGIGIGAAGYEGDLRYTNITTLKDYLMGKREYEKNLINKYDNEYEFIMLNLRTKYGIELSRYKEKFNKDFMLTYKEAIDSLKDLIIIENDSLHVKDNNYMILDTIILKFITKLEESENG